MTFFNWDWTPEESATHYAKINFWNAAIVAFMVALTQYAVSQWIWFGGRKKTNRPPHHAPVYLVSLMVFGYIWDTIFNFYLANRTVPFGTQIATPVVVLAGAPLNLLFCWVWAKVFPAEKKNGDDIEEEEIIAKVEGGAAPKEQENQSNAQIEEGAPATKKPSIDYINNIKIYLTVLVILHHCATAVMGLTGFAAYYTDETSWWYKVMGLWTSVNQAFFMHLFFFFSGYFVPRSFDKKGAYVFITERAKRLGIPFVVYVFLLGPFCRRMYILAFYEGSGEVPFWILFEEGPSWFLSQLIVLGIAYSFLCGKGWSPKIACPSLLGFLGIATVVGLLASMFSMAFPSSETVVMVPMFWGYYLSYVVFFFGGALAYRNNWMESIKAMPRAPIYVLAVISFGLLAFGMFYEIPLKWPLWATMLYNGVNTAGWGPVVFSLAVTVFFMDFLDKTYFFTGFFAKSMYTAYIIHMPITISLAVASLTSLYEATGHIEWVEMEGVGEFYYIEDPNYFFAAFVFVAVVANIITWPLAYGIRSIPGFSQVL